jgi:hypothetical protein
MPSALVHRRSKGTFPVLVEFMEGALRQEKGHGLPSHASCVGALEGEERKMLLRCNDHNSVAPRLDKGHRACLDAKFFLKFYYVKRRFPITSKCRHMYGVLNVDEIKN